MINETQLGRMSRKIEEKRVILLKIEQKRGVAGSGAYSGEVWGSTSPV